MELIIEEVKSRHDEAAMRRIRKQVFEVEMGIVLPGMSQMQDAPSLDLLAIAGPDGEPVAAMRVIETTANEELHRRCGLAFSSGSRIARGTNLAVIKPYRGMNIPLMLMLEAHRRFVAGRFDFTWLLFEASRAETSFLCRHLAFAASPHVVRAEYGLCRALVRDERAPGSEDAIRQAETYLAGFTKNPHQGYRPPESQPRPVFIVPGREAGSRTRFTQVQ